MIRKPAHAADQITRPVRTPRRFVYGAEITAGFDQAPVEVVYGDGDGIANAETLRAPERWPEDASYEHGREGHYGISRL